MNKYKQRKGNFYSSKIQKAIRFAIKVHEQDQKHKRKGSDIPYITHSLIVGLIISQVTDSNDLICAGILHDTIEDCDSKFPITKEILQKEFGKKIADIVNNVTEQDKSLPWKIRKQRALDHIPHMNKDTLLVKSADVLHNLTDLLQDFEVEGDAVFDRFNAPKDQTITRYKNLLKALETKWPENPLLKDLEYYTRKLISLVQ